MQDHIVSVLRRAGFVRQPTPVFIREGTFWCIKNGEEQSTVFYCPDTFAFPVVLIKRQRAGGRFKAIEILAVLSRDETWHKWRGLDPLVRIQLEQCNVTIHNYARGT